MKIKISPRHPDPKKPTLKIKITKRKPTPFIPNRKPGLKKYA